MLHLLVLRYRVAEHEAEPYVAEHVRYLERHHRAGTFLVSGQTVPSAHGGAIVARGVDRAAVERITTEDPFVRAGVAEYMVTTIDPGRVHPALAELLGVGASRVRPSPAGGEPVE
ncbi:YciI family protein [Pyxidicoccus caerfyrddinensis]|uniref:YciI family protein n=1 Tax=Pyxidicoccus caerfyrddinensis TaxID=2709663 RepID=UPI0013DA3E1D|nr:YciI family protein [Pyxidicoccus caerfyrddinensis]